MDFTLLEDKILLTLEENGDKVGNILLHSGSVAKPFKGQVLVTGPDVKNITTDHKVVIQQGVGSEFKHDGVVYHVIREEDAEAYIIENDDGGELEPNKGRTVVEIEAPVHETVLSSGLIIPHWSATDHDGVEGIENSVQYHTGTVLATSDNEIGIADGDKVMIEKDAFFEVEVGGNLIALVRDENIQGVFGDENKLAEVS